MPDPVNMIQLVQELPARDRGRACIVMTHDYSDQKAWAAKLARQTKAEHVDLLELFSQTRSMTDRLRELSVIKLFDLLQEHAEQRILIVSGIEFLKATWSGQPASGEQFASQVETWQDDPALLFVMQYDKALDTRSFSRRYAHTFVVDQRETIKL